MNLRQMFGEKLPPEAELKKHYEKLSDEIDGPTSLQYVIVEGYLGLRTQGNRDGWMNWSEWYEETISILRAYVPEGAGLQRERIRRDLDAIQEAGQTGADKGRFAYEELDRVALDVINWCQRNEKLIQLPDGVDSWLDTISGANG